MNSPARPLTASAMLAGIHMCQSAAPKPSIAVPWAMTWARIKYHGFDA